MSQVKKMNWTDQEIRVVRKYYQKGSLEVMKRLPGRTQKAIQSKARDLGLLLSKEALTNCKRAANIKARKALLEKKIAQPHGPFEVIPDEYLKVSSIFRVGHRYAVQEGV